MLLPVALNGHLVCIFCLLQNLLALENIIGKLNHGLKKEKKLFQNQTEEEE